MQTQDVKAIAHQIINQLPDNCTWEDLMQQIYVRQSIEAGLNDSAAGRVKSVEEVRQLFGLEP
jgi:predicted transcriptional regulator